MIIFELTCDKGHAFEGWFRNSEDYHDQLDTGLLLCPKCGSNHITKRLSASHLNFGKAETIANPSPSTDEQQILGKIRHYIESNFEDVGNNFRNEAFKMHYGEKEKSKY